MKDLHNAFPPTPERVEDAIYEGVRRARRRALMRRRLQRLAAAAAVVAVLVGAFSFLRGRVRPDTVFGPGGQRALSGPAAQSASPRPTDAQPSPAPTQSASPDPTSALPSPAPTQSASPRPTLTPTPEPTEASQTRAEAPADGDLASVPELPAIAAGEAADAPIATDEAPLAAVSPEPTESYETPLPAMAQPSADAMELPAAEAEQLALSLGRYIASDPDAEAEALLAADPLEMGVCFSTDTGTWFHVESNCMNMTGAKQRTLREALAMGQDFCPACISFAKDDGDPAWSREADEYYHASALCAGIEDEAEEAETALTLVSRARLQGKLPCPNCVTREQTAPAVLTGLLYCTAGGEWVHAAPNCKGMRDPMGCLLSHALEMGKSICPDCIGTDCIYVNGVVWEPEAGQLLISADICASASRLDPISGAYIDVSAMDAVSTGLNSWDEAVLASAASVAGETPLRVDTRELDIACDAGDSVAAAEWTDAGGRHLRLLLSGVTEEEAASLELSVTVSERFYCLWDGQLFVHSAPSVETRLSPLGASLNYVYDDAGNCVRFAPGNMLEAYDWRQDAAVEPSWAIEGMDADAHIALYRLDAISESADGMVILEVRTPANATISPDFGGARRVRVGTRAEGEELVHTAILSDEQAEAVFEDPSLLGFAETPVVNAY